MKFSVFKILVAATMLLCATLQTQLAVSQFVTRHTLDSASASQTRYITFTSTPDGVTGLSLTIIKASGAMAATVTIERRVDTLGTLKGWVTLPSSTYTFTDAAELVTMWSILPQDGNGYRAKIVSTSATQKAYYYFSYLRRTP